MTDNDIIKALEICIGFVSGGEAMCNNCPLHDCDNCSSEKLKQALNLINRQQAEIEKLNVELVGMRGACESYKMHYDNAQAEIERLQKFKTYFDSLYGINLEVEGWHENGNTISFDEFYDSAIEDMDSAEHHISYIIKCVKSEAIKEFAERLKAKGDRYAWVVGISKDEINHLVKEMTEVNENGKV